MNRIIPMSLMIFLIMPINLLAQNGAYADFAIRSQNADVVEDILAEGNDFYVKLPDSYWNRAIIVKISNKFQTDYRTWWNGEEMLAVKVYRTNKQNKKGYTYRINTSAKFIEYWADDELILHLERTNPN